MPVTASMMLEMFRCMVRIREFKQAAMDVFKRGLIKGADELNAARFLIELKSLLESPYMMLYDHKPGAIGESTYQ